MQKVIFSMGTNLGNKVQNLYTAAAELSNKFGLPDKSGSIYETEPWGFKSDHTFLNQLVSIHTTLSPDSLLNIILDIERSMGRKRNIDSGYVSRIIDIDILFYGDEIIRKDNLIIPHPLIQERRFILIPLIELVPSLIHPVYHITPKQMLERCQDKTIVRKASISINHTVSQ